MKNKTNEFLVAVGYLMLGMGVSMIASEMRKHPDAFFKALKIIEKYPAEVNGICEPKKEKEE